MGLKDTGFPYAAYEGNKLESKDMHCCGNCKHAGSKIVQINKRTKTIVNCECLHPDPEVDTTEPWSICSKWEYDGRKHGER